MTLYEAVLFAIFAAILLLLFAFIVRIWVVLKRLNSSFAKLGFLVREDAKKYFDDAADKIVDTNEQFQEMYKKIVEEGTRSVLAESSTITERVVADAHAQANNVILAARTDSQRIVQAAQKEAGEYSQKTLNQTGDAISWVMTQYLNEVYTVADHEALIEKQVKMYVNEHRQ